MTAVKPSVTIALPVYNGAKTLTLAVNSIINQSYQEWELIILDDASTDCSREVMRTFSDPRIHLVEGDENLGLSARLNMAVDMARGSYFARMDQDDVSYPERIQKQLDFLQTNLDVDMVASATTVFRGDGEAMGCLPVQCEHEQICAKPWNGFHMPHPTWMGKTSWFRKFKYDSFADGAEDQHLLLTAYQHSHYACISEPLLAYREDVRPLKKMLSKRRIFAWVYIHQFASSSQYGMAFKVFLVAILKAIADVLNLVFGINHMRNSLRPLSDLEKAEWEGLWEHMKSLESDAAVTCDKA